MFIFDLPVSPYLTLKQGEKPPENLKRSVIWVGFRSAQPARAQGNTFVDVFDNKHKSLCAASDGGGGGRALRRKPSSVRNNK